MRNQKLYSVAEVMNDGLMGIVANMKLAKNTMDPEADKCIEEDNTHQLQIYVDIMKAVTGSVLLVREMQIKIKDEIENDLRESNTIVFEEGGN